MSDRLKQQLIRLGNERPDLRNHLRPVLDVVTASDRRVTEIFDKMVRKYEPDEIDDKKAVWKMRYKGKVTLEIEPDKDEPLVAKANMDVFVSSGATGAVGHYYEDLSFTVNEERRLKSFLAHALEKLGKI